MSRSGNDRIQAILEKRIGPLIKRIGEEHDYWCPFCESGRHKLHVNYRKNVCICHSCGRSSRNLLNIVRDLQGDIPLEIFREAGVKITSTIRKIFEGGVKQAQQIVLPPEYVRIKPKKPTFYGKFILNYLTRKRGITVEQVQDSAAGYCCTGKYGGSAVFPIHQFGKLIFFTSRKIFGGGPKVQHAVGEKRGALFNFDQAIGKDRVLVGEGPFDAFGFERGGFGGVAVMGKTVSSEQARMLSKLPAYELTVCFDRDAHDYTVRAAEALYKVCPQRISYILLESRKDPGETAPIEMKEIFRERKRFGLETVVEAALKNV